MAKQWQKMCHVFQYHVYQSQWNKKQKKKMGQPMKKSRYWHLWPFFLSGYNMLVFDGQKFRLFNQHSNVLIRYLQDSVILKLLLLILFQTKQVEISVNFVSEIAFGTNDLPTFTLKLIPRLSDWNNVCWWTKLKNTHILVSSHIFQYTSWVYLIITSKASDGQIIAG